eukprot:g56162.t1
MAGKKKRKPATANTGPREWPLGANTGPYCAAGKVGMDMTDSEFECPSCGFSSNFLSECINCGPPGVLERYQATQEGV